MEVVQIKLLALAVLLAALRLVLTVAPGLEPKARHRVTDWCDTGAVASLASLLLITFVFQLSQVDGDSMLPSLHNGEFTIVNKLIYRLHSPQRGDVVVFRAPTEEKDYIKRVIGLPGETVEIKEGWVYVNGLKLQEPYELEKPEADYPYPPYKIPLGHLYVMGDNRRNSTDSRVFGPLDITRIRGKCSFITYPPSRWGFIQSFRGKMYKP